METASFILGHESDIFHMFFIFFIRDFLYDVLYLNI